MADVLFTLLTIILIVPVSLFLGIIYAFLVRKFSARFQWRVGPVMRMYGDLKPLLGASRILQPLYDILKLMGKQTILPETSRKTLFVASPYLSLAFAVLVVFFIPFPGMPLLSNTPYSMIIASYLIIGSVVFTILGPVASGSPWGVIGARREVELFLVSELGFVVSIFSVAYAEGTLSLYNMASRALNLPMLLLMVSAGILMFLSMLGKLHIKPFDIPEAECEIVAGQYTEYSGKLLGMYFLAKAFMLYGLVALFIAVFLPPFSSSILWLPVYAIAAVLVVLLLSIVQVLNPRYQIDRALPWYMKVIIPLGLLSFIIALVIRLVM